MAYQLWFDGVEELRTAMRTPEYAKVTADYDNFLNPRYRHELPVRQHWVIGPEGR